MTFIDRGILITPKLVIKWYPNWRWAMTKLEGWHILELGPIEVQFGQ